MTDRQPPAPEVAEVDVPEPPDEVDVSIDLEAPEADTAEQLRTLIEDDDETAPDLPLDADPADVTEQRRVVAYDEDDYR